MKNAVCQHFYKKKNIPYLGQSSLIFNIIFFLFGFVLLLKKRVFETLISLVGSRLFFLIFYLKLRFSSAVETTTATKHAAL